MSADRDSQFVGWNPSGQRSDFCQNFVFLFLTYFQASFMIEISQKKVFLIDILPPDGVMPTSIHRALCFRGAQSLLSLRGSAPSPHFVCAGLGPFSKFVCVGLGPFSNSVCAGDRRSPNLQNPFSLVPLSHPIYIFTLLILSCVGMGDSPRQLQNRGKPLENIFVGGGHPLSVLPSTHSNPILVKLWWGVEHKYLFDHCGA